MNHNTIFAIASGAGHAAIAVLRLSGTAVERRIFLPHHATPRHSLREPDCKPKAGLFHRLVS